MQKRGLGTGGRTRSSTAPISAPSFLSIEDLREIDSAASEITIQGARYPEELEKRTGL